MEKVSLSYILIAISFGKSSYFGFGFDSVKIDYELWHVKNTTFIPKFYNTCSFKFLINAVGSGTLETFCSCV